MATMETRSVESPDETWPFQAHGHMDVVILGGIQLGKGMFEPGWSGPRT